MRGYLEKYAYSANYSSLCIIFISPCFHRFMGQESVNYAGVFSESEIIALDLRLSGGINSKMEAVSFFLGPKTQITLLLAFQTTIWSIILH